MTNDFLTSIESVEPILTARWSEHGAFWIVVGMVAGMLAVVWHYRTHQKKGSLQARTVLGILRGTLLGLLLLTLALPALRLGIREIRYPTVYWVFDGTDSMTIRDHLPASERADTERVLDGQAQPASSATTLPTRMEHLQQWLQRPQSGSLAHKMAESPVRWQAFLFDGTTTSRLQRISTDGANRLTELAARLTTNGQVTALGAVFQDLTQQPGAGELGAVVLFSDFAHNSGPSPTLDDERSALRSINVPVHTVGVGPQKTVDLLVDLQTDAKMKRGERTELLVQVRQAGLDELRVGLKVTARHLDDSEAAQRSEPVVVDRREITLTGSEQSVRVAFVPDRFGEWEFVAEVDRQRGEVISQNNRVVRQVTVIDEHLRLLYVAHEPTWEWRFIKEVFHRDELVGLDGFRTYLGSSDPQVRRRNELFLESLTPPNSEFFENDVIFLGDLPSAAITARFGEMVEHFVGRLGGGLVVIAGPRFGPSALIDSPISGMLPVYLERESQLRDDREFRLRLTPYADHLAFMELQAESDKVAGPGWDNLDELPWYQPVAAVHPQATVLAEHPRDTCRDGRTLQPLIALRRYGNGEVVYLGFNEMWRLRRTYGERYYRRFWSQLIYRLGMSHAIGADKRFVLRTDRQQYRVGDTLTLSVQAYDENYEPFSENDLPPEGLVAEILAADENLTESRRRVSVPLVREGILEAQLPVLTAGRFRVRATDPVTGRSREQVFRVSDASAEQQSAVRNVKLQREISRITGGQAHELHSADELADELELPPTTRRVTRIYPLWNTPFWFVLIVGLMLTEWLGRRVVDLR